MSGGPCAGGGAVRGALLFSLWVKLAAKPKGEERDWCHFRLGGRIGTMSDRRLGVRGPSGVSVGGGAFFSRIWGERECRLGLSMCGGERGRGTSIRKFFILQEV